MAAQNAGIPPDRVIPLDTVRGSRAGILAPDLHELIAYGLEHQPHFVERTLKPGEGRTKIAFLSYSSGTTGKPKASSAFSRGFRFKLIASFAGGGDSSLCPHCEHPPDVRLVESERQQYSMGRSTDSPGGCHHGRYVHSSFYSGILTGRTRSQYCRSIVSASTMGYFLDTDST